MSIRLGGLRGLAAGIGLTLVLAGLQAIARTRAAPAGMDDPVARRSWAIGFSTGAGARDVAPVSIDEFRRGLADGLRGEAHATRTMPRPERIALIRDLHARIAEARLDAIASRLDQDEER